MLGFPSDWPTLTPMLAFGFLLLVGALGGFFAHKLRYLPSITGFMLAGYLVGPGALGLVPAESLKDAKILVDISLALILYRLGTSLDWRLLRAQPRILLTSLAESLLSFFCVFGLLVWLDLTPLLSALIAAILVSSSPAVLLHVAHETGAKGPVTESAKILVGLNNLWSYGIFILLTPWLLHGQDVQGWGLVTQPAYLLFGSMTLGMLLGWLLHELCLRTQSAPQYQLAMVIGIILLSLNFAQQLNLSTLLTPLLVGIAVRSLERDHPVSNLNFGAAFELFFIVLFVFAGANLHLSELWHSAGIILLLVLVRTITKWLMLLLVPVDKTQSWRARRAQGLMLMPMAGLAIGLVNVSNSIAPQYAGVVSALVLGAITVFESLGPPVVAFAFQHCGEAEAESEQPAQPDDGTPPVRTAPAGWPEPASMLLREYRVQPWLLTSVQPEPSQPVTPSTPPSAPD